MNDPLNTNTDAVLEDEDMDIPTETTDDKKQAKRNYFAIYHDETLLNAVEQARGTESANAFLTRLICSALNVPVPARKTRRRFKDAEQAQAVRELEQSASDEAARILRQRDEYAALMAEALKQLES